MAAQRLYTVSGTFRFQQDFIGDDDLQLPGNVVSVINHFGDLLQTGLRAELQIPGDANANDFRIYGAELVIFDAARQFRIRTAVIFHNFGESTANVWVDRGNGSLVDIGVFTESQHEENRVVDVPPEFGVKGLKDTYNQGRTLGALTTRSKPKRRKQKAKTKSKTKTKPKPKPKPKPKRKPKRKPATNAKTTKARKRKVK